MMNQFGKGQQSFGQPQTGQQPWQGQVGQMMPGKGQGFSGGNPWMQPFMPFGAGNNPYQPQQNQSQFAPSMGKDPFNLMPSAKPGDFVNRQLVDPRETTGFPSELNRMRAGNGLYRGPAPNSQYQQQPPPGTMVGF
jgi:hypothetical protein